jgi:molybdopterin synthase catalytic subunit
MAMDASGIVDKEDFNPEEEIEAFIGRNSRGGSGGFLFFLGVVKDRSWDGREVVGLEIEAGEEIATQEMRKIAEEVKEKYGLEDTLLIHAQGTFKPGEPLVLVALAGRSRKEILPAMEEAIHSYKTRPPIFKKEVYSDGGEAWIKSE